MSYCIEINHLGYLPKIYGLRTADIGECAYFMPRGRDDWEGPVCSICRVPPFVRPRRPLSLEYAGGAPADLMAAMANFLVPRPVGEALADEFRGIELRPVEFYPGDSLRSEPDHPLPPFKWDGPELVEMWFPRVIPYNSELTKLRVDYVCPECGRADVFVDGIEKGIGKGRPNRTHAPDQGLRIPKEALEGDDVFRYATMRFMVLEPFKEFVERQSYTNFDFVDYGYLL